MRKVLAAVLLLNLILVGFPLVLERQRQATFASTSAYVDRQISGNRCTPREVAARQIGWVEDLDTAFALGRKSGRPLFIISGDGDICTGRL